MRIALTGALHSGDPGFIGRWLRRELLDHGHQVQLLGYDVRLGVFYPKQLLPFDAVVHLAARVGRENSEKAQRDVVDTNAWGTYNVAKACEAARTRLLYVSSSEAAYAGNLYGLTKRWGEDAVRLAYTDCEDEMLIARLFMPYGPGHPPGSGRAALTNWLWQAMRRRELIVHRSTSRSWCWVGDTVAALRLLLESWPASDVPQRVQVGDRVWNVGRVDNVQSSLNVAQLAVKRYGGGDYSLIRQVERPAGVVDHKFPEVEALYGLGWRPTVDLLDGMDRTAAWLREYAERYPELATA